MIEELPFSVGSEWKCAGWTELLQERDRKCRLMRTHHQNSFSKEETAKQMRIYQSDSAEMSQNNTKACRQGSRYAYHTLRISGEVRY